MSYGDGIKNAVIESARIDIGDRGLLDCWLGLDYGGSGQGFGGYALYLPRSWLHHSLESVAGHHLFRVMEIAGVTQWDQLKGKTIRARVDNGLVKAIGHIIKDDWYCPVDDFAPLRERQELKERESMPASGDASAAVENSPVVATEPNKEGAKA